MQNTILISTAVVATLPIIAVGHFLLFGWPARKQQIVSRFSTRSIDRYKETFCPKCDFTDNAGFAKEYDVRYGRRRFWAPVISFCVAVFFLSYLSIAWVLVHDWGSASDATAKIAISSLAGAYVWITYDLITRARQNDIGPSDINQATLRLLISLPFGFAISAVAGEAKLITSTLAFFVGAFPTDTVLKIMRRTAGGAFKLDADSGSDNILQLTKIDGISVPIAERFIDEGVKTILQLAYTDPVALAIRSGMDFPFILLCCNQALVRMYFNDEQIKAVQKFGLRSGFEIKTLNDALKSYDTAVDDAAKAGTPEPKRNTAEAAAKEQLDNFAAALALDPASTRFILDQIAEDPYTEFVWWMWPDTARSQAGNQHTAPAVKHP
jgi:hypothetical protein